MQLVSGGSRARRVPKRHQRHFSYDEGVDEAPSLIAVEAADVEAEIPCDENEPVERVERDEASAPPAFDDE
jgi:hypothetical protein